MKDPIIFQNSLPCSHAFAYYPFLLHPDLKSLAILRLQTPGRYTPANLVGIQKHSFWVYTNDKLDLSSDSTVIPFKNE